MKKFMLASRIFLAIIFLIAIYLIYNPFDGQRDNDNIIKNSTPWAVAGIVDTRVTLLWGGWITTPIH